MIRTKLPEEIQTLAEAGSILASVLDEVEKRVQVGATGTDLDELARELVQQAGAVPAFLGYAPHGHDPYPAALCVSVNDEVVHGIPKDIPFKEGDVVGIDAGLIYDELYVDSARTVPVGNVSPEVKKLLAVTKEALQIGIEAAQLGNTTGHIGEAIQTYVEGQGFGVVRQLVGHGVGYGVHEDPAVPNYGRAGRGDKLIEGLVIAIEPMVTIGDSKVITASDGWTVKTRHGNLCAHEEHTIAITKAGPLILTQSRK